jgi:endoglucanase
MVLCLLLAASFSAFATVGSGPGTGQASSAKPSSSGPPPAAAQFLAAYVRPDGRVSRPDQGGDTVSEGQAYGLLLAEVAGRDDRFGRIWQWTQDHLQRPDGLFAWHADAAGHILDPGSASDADLLIAWALLRYQGPGAASAHQDGKQVAGAILAQEVSIIGPARTPVLTAGPWAAGHPATLDPSYWSLPALTGLASLTGNHEWLQIADGAVTLTAQLTRNGAQLPPDWAGMTADGAVYPEAQYGLDAQRTVVWFAASCVPQARTLAARWWRLLRLPGRSSALTLTLSGAIVNPASNALPFAAAAAAADAAGDAGASRRLLSGAASQQQRQPGYYGGAWAAFGPTLLDTGLLNGC